MTITGQTKEALDAVASTNGGRLYPAQVVDAARDNANPLHKHFEWDDGVAAEAYRIEQAEHLIRKVIVILEPRPDVSIRVRAWQSLPADRGSSGFYRTTESVLDVPELRQQMLDAASTDLRAFRKKYSMLKELAKVMEAIDSIVDAA